MASIIQIKFGSGANTPTAGALANAELALNVDTGHLYYGSGSDVAGVGLSSPVTQSGFQFLNTTASSATGSFTGSFIGTFANDDVTALKADSASTKLQTASLLAQTASLLTYTSSNNALITSFKLETASLHAHTASFKAETASLHAQTASVAASITSFKLETASLHAHTASFKAETASLHTFTASFTGTTFASLLTHTASINAQTASLLTNTASVAASITSFKLETASLHAQTASLLTNTASVAASITSFKAETASLHAFTASGFQSPLSMSVGTTLSNTTNIAGTPLYVHGKISASDEIEGSVLTAATISGSNKFNTLTASIGTRASTTTNLAGTPLYVHGKISASGNIQGSTLTGTIQTVAQTNITSLGQLNGLNSVGAVVFEEADELTGPLIGITTLKKTSILSASIGTNTSNTTNTAGNVLYVHGNTSGSGKATFATASIGAPASVTTNVGGTPLYVHGNISASGRVFGQTGIFPTVSSSGTISTLTASIGTSPSTTTNVAGTPLYVHGNISASGNIIGRQYEQITTNFSDAVGDETNDFIYMPFAEQSTTENTNKANMNVNRVCAVPGRPIRTVVRATGDNLGDSMAYTMSAHYLRTGSNAEVHVISVYGTTDGNSNKDAIIFNWANADSGSHDFFMTGDRMLMGIRTTNTDTAGYLITHIWEWDYNLI